MCDRILGRRCSRGVYATLEVDKERNYFLGELARLRRSIGHSTPRGGQKQVAGRRGWREPHFIITVRARGPTRGMQGHTGGRRRGRAREGVQKATQGRGLGARRAAGHAAGRRTATGDGPHPSVGSSSDTEQVHGTYDGLLQKNIHHLLDLTRIASLWTGGFRTRVCARTARAHEESPQLITTLCLATLLMGGTKAGSEKHAMDSEGANQWRPTLGC